MAILTLNEERNLPGCLDAIDAQTVPREQLEVLVIDNNSDDRTVELATGRADLFYGRSRIGTSRR